MRAVADAVAKSIRERKIASKKRASKKVQLVLGGGGARGIAHIKIIELLERDGFEIQRIIGCSMGAVVGGIYCTGRLDIYREWLLTLTRSQLFRLLDFTITNMGFLKGERVLGKMQEITGPQRIEDLKIPFTAVATDMIKAKEVVFDTGDLYAAMRASISIPGVFTPVIDEKCTLVDGGVLNPLPLNLANFADESLVVAVSLNGCDALPSLSSDAQQRIEDGLDKEIDGNNRSWINRFLHYGKPKQPVSTSVANTAEHTRLSLINLLANSYEMTQDKLVELTINAYKPDILIEVPRTSCGIFDFHKAQHMLDIGEQCYNLAVDKLLSGSDADRAPLQLSKMRKSRV